MRALITTTVNIPYNLENWRASGMSEDDVVIVAGDYRSPHTEIRDLLTNLPGENVYLHPDDQTEWVSSEVIGWNVVQRRNIALLEAIRRRPDWIMTIDDDNWPTGPNQWGLVDEGLAATTPEVIATPSGWFDVGRMLSPTVSHRGFPIWERGPDTLHYFHADRPDLRVGVVASLWYGDPDVDAVTRMALGDVYVDRLESSWDSPPGTTALATGTWCPFNSQAVAYRAELAPLMMVWPGVGRYDDIWASFLARAVMDQLGYLVAYGNPPVDQSRNVHNVFTDLEAELFGMRHNREVIDALRAVQWPDENSSESVLELVSRCYAALSYVKCLPEQTQRSFPAWLTDVRTALA